MRIRCLHKHSTNWWMLRQLKDTALDMYEAHRSGASHCLNQTVVWWAPSRVTAVGTLEGRHKETSRTPVQPVFLQCDYSCLPGMDIRPEARWCQVANEQGNNIMEHSTQHSFSFIHTMPNNNTLAQVLIRLLITITPNWCLLDSWCFWDLCRSHLWIYHHKVCSGSCSAEVSGRSPGQLHMFIIKKICSGSKFPKNIFCDFENKSTEGVTNS